MYESNYDSISSSDDSQHPHQSHQAPNTQSSQFADWLFPNTSQESPPIAEPTRTVHSISNLVRNPHPSIPQPTLQENPFVPPRRNNLRFDNIPAPIQEPEPPISNENFDFWWPPRAGNFLPWLVLIFTSIVCLVIVAFLMYLAYDHWLISFIVIVILVAAVLARKPLKKLWERYVLRRDEGYEEIV